jgi:hypothetical protein
MEALMKSPEVLVTEENGAITVRPRMAAGVTIFSCGIALAVALLVVGLLIGGTLPAFASFSFWGATVIAGLSVLVLMAALWVRVSRGAIMDMARGTLRKGRRVVRRASISDIVLRTAQIMDREILTIVATTDEGELLLVTGHSPRYRQDLALVAQRMKSFVLRGNASAAEAGRTSAAPTSARTLRWFPGLVMIILGALISISGYFMIPDLLLTRPGLSFGVLFWPVGIWIAVAAIPVLAGSAMKRMPLFRHAAPRIIPIAVWLVSYFVICLRRVG